MNKVCTPCNKMRSSLSFRKFCLLGLATAAVVYVFHYHDRHRDILRGEGRKISSSEIEARQLGKHVSVEQTEVTHEDRKHDTVDAPGTEANSEKHDSVVAMEEVQRGSKHESGGAAAMRQDDSKRDNIEETKVRQEESKHGGVKASKTGQEDGEDGTVEATELKEDDIKHQTQEGMHTRGGDNKQDGVAANEARKDRKQHGSREKNEPEYGNSTDHSVPDTDNFMSVHGDRLTKRFLGFISKPNITIADMFEEEEIVSILLNMMSSTKYKCDDIQRMGVPVPKDGGYYVCMDVGVKPENCIVYSVGIRNLWSFDDAMADYGCNVYCFDPFHDLKTHRRSERVMFYDIALCGDDDDERKFIGKHPPVRCRTLESLKKMLHHEKEVIDVLKFDIEGNEFECLPQMIESGVLASVKQLVFEIHMVKPWMKRVIDACQYLGTLQQKHGFKLWYSREPTRLQKRYFGEFTGHNSTFFELSWVNTNFLKNLKP